MKITAVRGSVSGFLKNHPECRPLISYIRFNSSTFNINANQKNKNTIKFLEPALRSNGAYTFGEVYFKDNGNKKVVDGFIIKNGLSDLNHISELIVYLHMALMKHLDVEKDGPLKLRLLTIGDRKNILRFDDDKNDDFPLDITPAPPFLWKDSPAPDPYPSYSLAV